MAGAILSNYRIIIQLFSFSAILLAQDEEQRVSTARVRPKGHYEFSAGLTASKLTDSLAYVTDHSFGRGILAECLYFPPTTPVNMPAQLFYRYRLVYHDWGNQQMVGLISSERSEVKRFMAVAGGGIYMIGSSRSGGLYFTIELGVIRWDIKTTYAPMPSLQFNELTGNFATGIEAWGFFIEAGFGVGRSGRRIKPNEQDIDKTRHIDKYGNLGNLRYVWNTPQGDFGIFSLGYRF